MTIGILERMGGLLGGDERVHHLATADADFRTSSTNDFHLLLAMIQEASQDYLETVLLNVARELSGQTYLEHIFKSRNGASPLVILPRRDIEMLASSLLSRLVKDNGTNTALLMNRIPMLRSVDPNEMTPHEVGALMCLAKQCYPESFGCASAELARHQPRLLHVLLGPDGLRLMAIGLAIQYCQKQRAA